MNRPARGIAAVVLACLAGARCSEPAAPPRPGIGAATRAANPAARPGHARLEILGPRELLPTVRIRRAIAAAPGFPPAVRWSEVPTAAILDVETPAGAETSVAASSTDALVWPSWQALVPGTTAVLHIEALRAVRLELGTPPGVAADVLVLVDRSDAPSGPPGRVAALDLLAGTGRFPRTERRAGGLVLRSMPPVPCHLLVRVGGEAAWARWDGAAPSLDLRRRPLRRFDEAPLLDGSPLAAGGIVAPGRLDLAAVAALSGASARRVRGAFLRRSDGPWRPADLPDAPVYTLWDAALGVAHATPDAQGRLAGTTCPGEIVLVADDGAPLTGHAAAWPCWPGDRTSFTRPADTGLRRAFFEEPEARFRGLPPGAYRLDYAFAPDGGSPGPGLRRAEAVIDESTSRATVLVHRGDERPGR